MNDYIKKILSKLSNPSWALKNRNDFVDVYGLSKDEYLNGIVDFEFKSLNKLEGKFFSTLTYKNSGSYEFIFKVTGIHFINYRNGIQSVGGNSLFGDITLLVNSWLLKVTVLPAIKEDTFVNAKVLPIPIAEDIVFPAPIKIDVESKLTTDNP